MDSKAAATTKRDGRLDSPLLRESHAQAINYQLSTINSAPSILQKPLAEVPGLTTRIVKMLAKEGVERVADVVWMLPFRHEDRRRLDALAFQAGETPCCHFVRVAKTHVKFFGRKRGAGVFEADVEHVDDNVLGQQLTLRWWNMPFMSKSIATDMELVVYGRIKEQKGKLFMDHPEYEIIRGGEDDDTATIHTGRITPVYRLRGGLSQKAVRTAAWQVMEMLDDRFIDDLLPPASEKGEFAGWHRSRALHTVHFPATAEELTQASRYLALEEFYGYQVRVVRRRRSAIEAGGKAHAGDGHLLHEFLRELPFELTGAQKRSLGEIRRDMASHAPMNRLLHGDVGSGKTVVALAAMLTAIESGSQAALMAPTQILAEQHFLTAQRWLAPLGVRVELRLGNSTGSRSEPDGKGSTGGPPVEFGGPPNSSSASEHAHGRREVSDDTLRVANAPAARSDVGGVESEAEGGRAVVSLREEAGGPPVSTGGPPVLPNAAAALRAPEIFIGTHALLYDRTAMRNLGLVVIDEQHKFGVAQRARLIEKGNTPDVLVMTATPIPRTLTLTIYGDLDVSTLDERPKERGKIVTKVRPQKKVAEAAAFLREQIEQGRQGYLVFPLIEDSEKLDAAAAKKGHEEWSKLLAPHRVGLLHGKLSAEEKELVMREFREGNTSALVSTTVIEVGVDVPNATVMYAHNAERFGLAQLHQLRGRIGRGSHTSYCVLFIKEDDDETKQRLAIMEETDDGFRIAEEDLRRRGPGDVLGRAQSGQAPLRFAELLADTRLVRLARQLAERTLDHDPSLSAPQHNALRQLVMEIDVPSATLQ